MRCAILAVFLSAGCASLMTQDHKRIHLSSEKEGTLFFVDNMLVKGDWTLINQRVSHELKGYKKGCAEEVTVTHTGSSPAFLMNFLWLLLGIVASRQEEKEIYSWLGAGITINWVFTDIATSSMNETERSEYNLTPTCGEK